MGYTGYQGCEKNPDHEISQYCKECGTCFQCMREDNDRLLEIVKRLEQRNCRE